MYSESDFDQIPSIPATNKKKLIEAEGVAYLWTEEQLKFRSPAFTNLLITS